MENKQVYLGAHPVAKQQGSIYNWKGSISVRSNSRTDWNPFWEYV